MDLAFGYANARVKGMKGNLLTAETIRGLFAIGTVNEYVDMLEKTAYKNSFVDASTRYEGIELALVGLRLEFDRTLSKLMRIIPQSSRAKAESLMSLWEIRPLTVVLAAKATGEKLDESYVDLLDVKGKAKATALMKASTFEDALRQLGHIGYKELAAKALKSYSKTKDYKEALRMIGRYYYENLAEHAAKEPEEQVRNILHSELEYFNCTTALRMKNAGIAKEKILEELVRAKGGDLATKIANAETIGAAVEFVSDDLKGSQDVLSEFKATGSISDVEIALEKKMFRKILSSTRISVLSLGTVLGFLYLKRREIENLRAIALSLSFPSREKLRRSVYSLHE